MMSTLIIPLKQHHWKRQKIKKEKKKRWVSDHKEYQCKVKQPNQCEVSSEKKKKTWLCKSSSSRNVRMVELMSSVMRERVFQNYTWNIQIRGVFHVKSEMRSGMGNVTDLTIQVDDDLEGTDASQCSYN